MGNSSVMNLMRYFYMVTHHLYFTDRNNTGLKLEVKELIMLSQFTKLSKLPHPTQAELDAPAPKPSHRHRIPVAA